VLIRAPRPGKVDAMTRRGLAELLSIVAPPACVACREPLGRADDLVCVACLRTLPWLRATCCARCGLPRHRHAACPAASAAFARSWAPMAYDGSARALVQALKFRGALPAAALMAAQIAATLPAELRAGTVVAVPPQRVRRRSRGFDPAALLARGVAGRLGLPLAAPLTRTDRSGPQARAGRRSRRAGGRLAVVARGVPAGPILLVDDVHTTGATLDACARALGGGGAIAAVTYARTL
jgi:predicted amidophosphoribosyltransferase